jgi:hypothetical protein
MNREIKIIKRAVLDRRQVESQVCNKPEVASPLQLARTIEEWVKLHRQRASEELSIARALLS